MTSAAECQPFHPAPASVVARLWRLLAALPRRTGGRVPRLDPQDLPPHRLRDLGLADAGLYRSDRQG